LALRAAILDPLVLAVSKGIAEMMSNKGKKTTAEEVGAAVQPLSLRYAGARSLIPRSREDPLDVENSAVSLAGRAIVDDTELPLSEAERNLLPKLVTNKLLEGLLNLELPKRIKAMETLL
jgi:hypothetical protein